MSGDALAIQNLSIAYVVRGRSLQVVHDVSFGIPPSDAYGLVGESGCGKSTVAFAIMRYLPKNAVVQSGRVLLSGKDLLTLDTAALRDLRGGTISMVYQDPSSALTPTMRIGEQVAEAYTTHLHCGQQEAMRRARDMLEQVQISDVGRVMRRYPHQLSGGQQQRVVIAMGLAAEPSALLLDEPTTGLDATVEAEVLDLIAGLRTRFNTSLLFISHDLRVVATVCDRVGVLYAGRLVEEGPASSLFADPKHPYTAGLVRCVPRAGMNKRTARLQPIPGELPALGVEGQGCVFKPRCPLATAECGESEPPPVEVGPGRSSRCFHAGEVDGGAPLLLGGEAESRPARGGLLRVEHIRRSFKDVTACEDVSLQIEKGEVLGVVGESGSGKTTLSRCIAGLVRPDAGDVFLNGSRLAPAVSSRRRDEIGALQMVFQNPQATLNPRHTPRFILRRAIKKLGGSLQAQELAKEVQLAARHLAIKSSGLSGGEKQRVAIGRALAGNPSLVICDEPVSALDVSVQAAILNLLAELSDRQGLSYMFISHDLAVVRYLADRIAVMYLAQLVEVGPSEAVFSGPQHPYTEALLSAAPPLGQETQIQRVRLQGPPPSLAEPPSGCRFHTRCPRKIGGLCETTPPPWRQDGEDHSIRCHIPPEELAALQQDVASRTAEEGSSPR